MQAEPQGTVEETAREPQGWPAITAGRPGTVGL